MSNVALLSSWQDALRCKYPKHGHLDVLKWHEGVVKADSAPTEHMPNPLWGRAVPHLALRQDAEPFCRSP